MFKRNRTGEQRPGRQRRPGTWSLFSVIVAWVVLALLLFTVLGWLWGSGGYLSWNRLLTNWRDVSDSTTTSLDLVKLSLTTIGGIGGVGYLVIKYRERASAERAEAAAELERVEQKLLSAVQQLGSESPQVRIAGVYSLTDVADTYRGDYRQRVVDILCGYLRTKRGEWVAATDAEDGADQIYVSDDGAVESTILDVMARHLRKRREASEHHPEVVQEVQDEQLWCGCSIDIHGAILTERPNFQDATFNYGTDFGGATFTQYANFQDATFTQDANFQDATVTQNADFQGVTFTRNAYFQGVTFSRNAYFGDTTFTQDADFQNATFSRNAYFGDTTFTQDADFQGVIFTRNAYFGDTTFAQNSYFRSATFTQHVDFKSAQFQHANFSKVTFSETARFRNSKFNQNADFRYATFKGYAYFQDSTFAHDAQFQYSTFSGGSYFQRSTFAKDAHFLKSTFMRHAFFDHTTFTEGAIFHATSFSGRASFNAATFTRDSDFQNATFTQDANFRDATFNVDYRNLGDSITFPRSMLLDRITGLP